jgi:hypothetical protein
MTLLRHVEACNRFDPSDYRRFCISSHAIGWVAAESANFLVARGLAKQTEDGVGIAGGGFITVSAQLAEITAALDEARLMAPRRGEMTPVLRKWEPGPVPRSTAPACRAWDCRRSASM